jgi:alpha-2-macroglobulin
VGPSELVGRSVFRPTAFFLTNIVTGPNGSAAVKTKLPDNLTTWKVFAVAANASDSFGEGETSFKTNKPVMVRPQLPRFLRTGDRFDATVMLDSLLKEPVEIALSVQASGMLSAVATTKVVTIPAEGHVPVRFPVEARNVGPGKLTFKLAPTKGTSFGDEITINEEVQPIASVEAVVVAGEIPKSATTVNERLGDLGQVLPDVGGFDYRVSTTPLVGLAESLDGLLEYPYGCTEQLTSRLVPLVRLRGMARDLGVTLPSNVDLVVRSSLASLLSHQREDGGFGFWSGSRTSEAWLTVLALGSLHAAEQHGYVVPASSIERARRWLERPADEAERSEAAGTSSPRAEVDLGSRAMLEDLLASLGRPRASELRALAADPKLPLFGQALVAHALVTVDRQLARQLLDRIASQAQLSGALARFADEASLVQRTHLSSNARTTAMVLRALLAVDPRHPLVTKTVSGLLSLRHDGRWRTTQDSAWALAAIEDARALYRPKGGRTSAEVLFDRRLLEKTSFAGAPGGETRSGSIAMSRLLTAPGASVSFVSDGERPLYYEGTLRYARTEPPTSPLDHGITIARSLRPLSVREAGASDSAGFHVGDYVVVDVMLVTKAPRELVVVDDPIPAGFEAVNEAFASMKRGVPIVVDPARELTHRELRDDRVVSFFDALPSGAHITRYALRAIASGRFALPPAKAECMYAPDVFGRTSSTWIETR